MHLRTLILALFCSALSCVCNAFDASGSTNVAAYWGQNSAGGSNTQESLASYCQDDTYDIILISFLTTFGSGGSPVLNVASACEGTYFSGSQLLNCPSIGEDIKTCQSNGKKIFLSMGGASGAYGLSSDSQGQDVATSLWNIFGGGESDTRPFGDAVIDGFDLDIEGGSSSGYAAFVTKMRQYYSSYSSKQMYISAAPQCPYPDAYVGDAISNSDIDFVFVQFYNNYCGVQTYGTSSFNYDTWNTYILGSSGNHNAKIYLGVPASQSAAGSGYVSSDQLKTIVQDLQSKYPSTFGGVMFWDVSQAEANTVGSGNYASAAKSYLLDGSSSSSASTSSSSSSSSSSGSTSTAQSSTSSSSSGSTSTAHSSTSSSSESTSKAQSSAPSSSFGSTSTAQSSAPSSSSGSASSQGWSSSSSSSFSPSSSSSSSASSWSTSSSGSSQSTTASTTASGTSSEVASQSWPSLASSTQTWGASSSQSTTSNTHASSTQTSSTQQTTIGSLSSSDSSWNPYTSITQQISSQNGQSSSPFSSYSSPSSSNAASYVGSLSTSQQLVGSTLPSYSSSNPTSYVPSSSTGYPSQYWSSSFESTTPTANSWTTTASAKTGLTTVATLTVFPSSSSSASATSSSSGSTSSSSTCPQQGGYCATHGEMVCAGTQFAQCVWNSWVLRSCPQGLYCFTIPGQSLVCDTKDGIYGEISTCT